MYLLEQLFSRPTGASRTPEQRLGAAEYSSAAVDTPCVCVPALGEAQPRKSIWSDRNGATLWVLSRSYLATFHENSKKLVPPDLH